VATIADLRARSIVDPATHCWIWQGAKINGSPRIWTLHIDDVEKRVLSGPRATWYIAHGTPLGTRVAYMGCWNPSCVCPAHVRFCASQSELNRLGARGGIFKRSEASKLANVANAAKARAAAGHRDTPPEVVQAVRAAAGPDITQRAIARSLGLSFTVVSRILRGETHRRLLLPAAAVSVQGGAACAR
jgi:hypothetical protein